MKHNYTTIFCLAFALNLIACTNGDTNSTNKVTYNFPEGTVIANIENDACLDRVSRLLNEGSTIDKEALEAMSKVSVAQEKEAGERYHKLLSNELKYVDSNDEQVKLLQTMLNKMLPYVERKEIHYRVFVVDDNEVLNAWTHAGGYIYVTTKLIDFVDTKDELAVVLGHEIGHNENHHVVRNLKRGNLLKDLGGIFGVDLGDDINEGLGNLFGVLLTPYNQPQEHEADKAGLYLAYKAGYDPEKGANFFEKLKAHVNDSWVQRFISSHPHPAERVACMHEYLDKSRQ